MGKSKYRGYKEEMTAIFNKTRCTRCQRIICKVAAAGVIENTRNRYIDPFGVPRNICRECHKKFY